MQAIRETSFQFAGQTGFYRGKVRDVYYFGDRMVMVATDRISAFDVVLPRAIPDKGRVLNRIAAMNLEATGNDVPNWVLTVPDPNVTIGRCCKPFPVEIVVRGYLAGHAWREYRSGKRSICGVALPEGLRENDPLPVPIITPTTKAHVGHDEDISRSAILSRGLVREEHYDLLEQKALRLFQLGSERAAARGLILVDTKYEFGLAGDEILLIDEVHTPDSSRYFYHEGYAERQHSGEPQRQLSKEFVRQWLMDNGFQGKEGQKVPEMTDAVVGDISDRYRELFSAVTGESLPSLPAGDILERIHSSIVAAL